MSLLVLLALLSPVSLPVLPETTQARRLCKITDGKQIVLTITAERNRIEFAGGPATVEWAFEAWQEKVWPKCKQDPNWLRFNRFAYESALEDCKTGRVLIFNCQHYRETIISIFSETL